jgi:TM2 domain-containing membrane protein YozV
LYNRKAVQASAEWYYIGHYGQLGPLTREQVDELIAGGVIVKDTYVWCGGMSEWTPAERVPDLRPAFALTDSSVMPPPPPNTRVAAPAPPAINMTGMGSWRSDALAAPQNAYPAFGTVKSDRSRVLAGILNLFLPGVGRIYLGHMAHGVLQLVLVFCGGVGVIWSFVDGIIILAGGVKYDGYGRVLTD